MLTGNQIIVGISSDNYWYPEAVKSDYSVSQNKISVTTLNAGYIIALDYDCLYGQKYIIESNNNNGYVSITFFNADGNFLSLKWNLRSGSEFTVPINAVFMTVDFIGDVLGELATFTDIKIIQN